MPKKQKRDNAYYEERLKDEFPNIYDDFLTGKIPSLRQAILTAGLKPQRTRVHELKNAWSKASPAEQREFARWLRTQLGTLVRASPSPTTTPGLIAVDRRLEPWATSRIQAIMAKRNIKSGQVMDELGFRRLDASLGRALARGDRLQPNMLAALEKWLKDNAGV